MAMDTYRSPRTIWNSYVPVRTGDGQSSRHSSEESLVSMSTDATTATSTTAAGAANDRDSESSSVSFLCPSDPCLHQLSPCHQDGMGNIPPSVGFRSSPDGSSLNSDDEESKVEAY